MMTFRSGARFIVVVAIALVLGCPGVASAGNGKKAYRKGIEHEEAQRWDRAAEQYAVALSEAPGNSEYRLRYARSVTNASIMLTQRGDTLAEQKDYAAAYQAYRQALAYDKSNELAGSKMRYMMRLQGLPLEEESGPETKLLKAKYERRNATIQIPESRRVKTDVVYRASSLRAIVDSLSESLGISVIYDKEFKDEKNIDFEVRNTTKGKALELLLLTNKLFYVQADLRTIIVAPDQPQNRARYQNLSVRTFFLRNAEVDQVRTLVQQIVATKYLVPNKQQNSLTVRDTPANLELIQSLIATVDKDRAEVLIEVNFYEADHNDVLELGNQFNVDTKNPGSLATFFGGIGQADALRAITPAGVFGPIGLALALPTSTLRAFQSSGKTRLLASTQVHVLDNEQHTIRIGQRVPIQTASFVGTGTTVVTTGGGNGQPNNNQNNQGFAGGPATQFQYENVGLNIDMQPVVHEDQVQIKMKIETSDVAANSGVGGNPIFTQRQMSSVASIKNGQTTLIAGVATENKSEGRQGLPLISLLPVIGRFFTVPKQSRMLQDVVITVTPYILRAPVYEPDDHIAIGAGTATAPDRQVSIEEIVYRAELSEAGEAPPELASTETRPPPRAPVARPKATDLEATFVDGAEPLRPIRAGTGEVIRTPGGRAPAPVVGPEDAAAPQPKPAPPVRNEAQAKPAAVPVSPADDGVDEEDDDEYDDEDEDEPEASGGAETAMLSMRLTGLQSSSVGKPMPVALWTTGSSGIASGTVAIQFNEQLLRVMKVESTGMFDGKLGNKLPFEVRNGMLFISMTRPPEMAKSPVNGQMLNITFEVLGAGAAALAVVPSSTKMLTVENASVAIRFESPLSVVLR